MSVDAKGFPLLDAESKVAEHPQSYQAETRLWLRLLTCTKLIEGEVRRRLRDEFDITLARFDLMAQIERSQDGVLLGDLSRRMMVSNGNVTGLVERLANEGLVKRVTDPNDRRAARVSLTETGQGLFMRMTKAHGRWMAEFFAGLSGTEQQALWQELGRMKASVRRASANVDADT